MTSIGEEWSVLVWNMALGSVPSRNADDNWAALQSLMSDESAQVALLSEAKIPVGANAIYEPEGTKGRDGKRRHWSSAVLADAEWVIDPIENARPANYLGQPRKLLPFLNSRPGTWTAATVRVPDAEPVTCVSLYGLLDYLSDASMHISLSEVSAIFSDERYNRRVILGGDFNVTTQWNNENHLLDKARGVVERIESYGLVDCLAFARGADRLEGCECILDPCTHTRTKWDEGKSDGGYPHQVDYLFASPSLVEDGGLVTCRVIEPDRWKGHSDHGPIVATFKEKRP